jgi:hypothetical protein
LVPSHPTPLVLGWRRCVIIWLNQLDEHFDVCIIKFALKQLPDFIFEIVALVELNRFAVVL